MQSQIPDINNRLLMLVDHYFNGNKKSFANKIGEVQQKFNRIFNVDSRSGKFPSVKTELVDKILKAFPEVSKIWILAGKEPMLLSQDEKMDVANDDPETPYSCSKCREKQRLIDQLIGENNILREQAGLPIPERNKKVI